MLIKIHYTYLPIGTHFIDIKRVNCCGDIFTVQIHFNIYSIQYQVFNWFFKMNNVLIQL